MSPLPLPPARRWRYFGLRLLLIAAIVGLLILGNRHYFFEAENYDVSDLAANTLSIIRAEHGAELYGNYSRWDFHHPGPAVFYGEALSEIVLYQWLHLVKTPYTAQVLFTLLLMVSFLAAGLSMAARWVRSSAFLALALVFAVWHFASSGAATLVLANWPPFVVALALFALLVGTASVAAGQGDDLPILALAGCFLLHMHAAQPLFVGPMFLLAYVGLWWSCWRRGAGELVPQTVVEVTPEGAVVSTDAPAVARRTDSALPWRVYPWAHRGALFIAFAFALPLLIDLLYGARSNFALILAHVRGNHGEHHSYWASLDYFLRFAVYQPSLRGPSSALTSASNAHEVGRFVARHPEMLAVWLAALLSPLLVVAARTWRGRETPLLGESPTAPSALAYAAPAGRARFLGALSLVWVASVGLTLVWGHLQDGELYFYNSWFNYTIWYTLALLAAGFLADALDVLTFRSEHLLLWRGAVVVACAGLAVFIVQRHQAGFQVSDDVAARMQARHVEALLDNEPANTPRAKLLVFPHDAWPAATGVAVSLVRRERAAYVLPDWNIMFGNNLVLADWQDYLTKPVEVNKPFEAWHLVPAALAPAGSEDRSVVGDYRIVPGGLPLDPNQPFQIAWIGEGHNCQGYICSGWEEGDGIHVAWMEGKQAWLQFRPQPVPAGRDVELTFDCEPLLVPGKRDAQRLSAFFNGLALGERRVEGQAMQAVRFVVPGAAWNKYASALMTFQTPDAIAPRDFEKSGDARLLSFKVSSLTFDVVPAAGEPTSPEAMPATTPEATPPRTEAMPTPTATPESAPEPTVPPTEAMPPAEPMPSTSPTEALPPAEPPPDATPAAPSPAVTLEPRPTEPPSTPTVAPEPTPGEPMATPEPTPAASPDQTPEA